VPGGWWWGAVQLWDGSHVDFVVHGGLPGQWVL
jgi:hypothetical protein